MAYIKSKSAKITHLNSSDVVFEMQQPIEMLMALDDDEFTSVVNNPPKNITFIGGINSFEKYEERLLRLGLTNKKN